MYSVAIAILGAVGAWLAWRRNPLYTGDSAFRLFAVTVLSIAASVLFVVTAVDHTHHRAEPATFTTLLTVVILATLVVIYVAQAASIPKAAQLTTVVPAHAKPVHLHRQRVYYCAKVVALLLATCVALGAIGPGSVRYILLWCDAVLVLLTAVLLPAMYSSALKFDRSLAALTSEPWVHWHYSQEEWQRWVDVQAERTQLELLPSHEGKRMLRFFIGSVVVIAAGILAFSRGSLAVRVDYAMLCVCGIAVAFMLGSRVDRWTADRPPESQDGAGNVYFGPDGLFINGVYVLWLGVSVHLVAASVDEREPRSLELMFERILPNPYLANRVGSLRHRIPIPVGGAGDLERLQRELKVRCPKARVALA
jgi:hypothetical protein